MKIAESGTKDYYKIKMLLEEGFSSCTFSLDIDGKKIDFTHRQKTDT